MAKYRAYIELSLECYAENEHDAKEIMYKKLLREIKENYENAISIWKPLDYMDEDGSCVINDK